MQKERERERMRKGNAERKRERERENEKGKCRKKERENEKGRCRKKERERMRKENTDRKVQTATNELSVNVGQASHEQEQKCFRIFFFLEKKPICSETELKTGNTSRGGRLSTIDLLIKVTCFIKRGKYYFLCKNELI
jgi:hypothetical protein